MIKATSRRSLFQSTALAGALALSIAGTAVAQERVYNIPAQSLAASLRDYGIASGEQIIFAEAVVKGRQAPPLQGAYSSAEALTMLLAQSGLVAERSASGGIMIQKVAADPQSGSAAGGGAEVEGLIVTAQKREENIQDVPIAMSAFSQETLTERQVAGGPDLITQIPNMSFTKTNFTSYSIQIRGIGTQAISATTDPAVAVAFNNTPFVRNHFFEQEFYDLERLEVLRGPQGTLYGRNATAGVVNLISAKPKFVYEAKASGDLGNYRSKRIEGMLNIPLVEDVVALRLAGAWTKRDGYAMNQMTGAAIDGRDLWSTRVSLRFEPTDAISANLIWEHFEEDDDRLRSGKQLCKKHVVPELNGVDIDQDGDIQPGGAFGAQTYVTQGCVATSLYSDEAFQTPNGFSLPYYGPLGQLGNLVHTQRDPYLSATQSRDLRVIESSVEPDYRAKMDLGELQVSIDLSDTLTLSSETAYNADELWSLQDYNRFTTAPNAFVVAPNDGTVRFDLTDANGVFCDPQLGCSDRLLLVDLSTSQSTQFSQELRLASDFDGPFNFSLGANYLRHDALDKYYVFINSLTMWTAQAVGIVRKPWVPGVTDGSDCVNGPGRVGDTAPALDPAQNYSIGGCVYIDPNPIGALNDQGRNYFLSKNPYKLVSYAAFGEVYYNITDDLKLTAGLRFTIDRKTAPQIPSWLLASAPNFQTPIAGEYPVALTVFQEWREPTGRLALDWKPVLPFTDETLVYASYAHGYKAGGANPPPPVMVTYGGGGFNAGSGAAPEPLPETFDAEFIDAFEIGTKNTLAGGALTLNLTGFYYDYKGYQISEIRNRSAVNSNYDAEVWGLEVEADWRATEALRLGFKGGYNGTRIADGEKAIDLIDRTAGNPDWIVVRPFPAIPSNCIIPLYVATAGNRLNVRTSGAPASSDGACYDAYFSHIDVATGLPYVPNPTVSNYVNLPVPPGYPGWDPTTAPNGGRGFDKQLGGNELPNAPKYTATLTVDYTKPLAGDWLVNLHADYHWQSKSWWRVFNDLEYDRLEGFSTVNLAAIFTNEDAGWKVMAYVKNVFDETALTGAFLNSDDTGLTTNVFLTEPRLYGLRVTKDWNGSLLGWTDEIGRCPDGVCPVTLEFSGGVGRYSGETQFHAPDWFDGYTATFPLDPSFQDADFDWGDTRTVKLTWAPWADWRVAAGYRFGKTKAFGKTSNYEAVAGSTQSIQRTRFDGTKYTVDEYVAADPNELRAAARDSEEHQIIDFMVGRSVGFGVLAQGGSSILSVGLRQAELQSWSFIKSDGIPNRVQRADFSPAPPYDHYTTLFESERSLEGVGPMVGWEASVRLADDEERGHVDLDWSIAGGALFGKQTTGSEEESQAWHYAGLGVVPTVTYDAPILRHRSEDVTVPTLSLSLGLSYTVDRVKVSTGYSYDRFFDAIDGGIDEARTYDRTIHGPFVKLSLGFGG